MTNEHDTILWSPLTPQHADDLAALYNQCFPVIKGKSFYDDFPVWNPSVDVPQRVQIGGWFDGRLVSSASLKNTTTICNPVTLKVGILGGVVTHPDYRGQGFGTKCIQKILEISDGAKNDVTVLWGSEEKLYSKFGFEYGGMQLRFLIQNLKKIKTDLSNFYEIKTGYNQELYHFRKSNKLYGVESDVLDEIWFSKHINTEWYVVYDTELKIKAYAAIGRGIDLPNWIHEWGGSQDALYLLLSKLTEINPSLEMIFHFKHQKQYEFFPDSSLCVLDPLAMFRWRTSDLKKQYENQIWFWGLESA